MKPTDFINLADPSEYAAISRGLKSPIFLVAWVLGIVAIMVAHTCFSLVWGHVPWLIGFAGLLALMTAIDAKERILPDALTVTGAGLGLLYAHVVHDNVLWAVLAMVLGFGLFFGLAWVNKAMTGQWGMGFGDAKLLGMIGAWGGLVVLLPTVLISSVLATLVAYSKRWRTLPYGPFLALAGLLSILVKLA